VSRCCAPHSLSDALVTASRTADFYTKRKPLSATINTLANALYKVFCASGASGGKKGRWKERTLKREKGWDANPRPPV
jgi:hypothetical protein